MQNEKEESKIHKPKTRVVKDQLQSLSLPINERGRGDLKNYTVLRYNSIQMCELIPNNTESNNIIKKARSLGATMTGIASTASLENSPSYQVYGKTAWPEEARSVLVLALVHEKNEPELDWWGIPGGTRGNQRLKKISIRLKKILKEEFNINAQTLPYQLTDGGIFLKDAAALAGLGIIGINNLLITPEFGPCTRLRALFLEKELTPTGPIDFSPCDTCNKACWQACPYASGGQNPF